MARYYQCPYCNKKKERADLITHIEKKHSDLIPEGYTPTRVAFNVINYGKVEYEGKCTECKGPTRWDENKARYDRQCGSKECKEKFVKRYEENMLRTKGVTRLSRSAEGQEMMLANRHISGRYEWSDGTIKVYTGSYEKKAAQFFDQVMNCKSEDVLFPGPVIYYTYNKEEHLYIPDIYYVPYNLIIEVKDGGDRPNTRNMPEYRARQLAKEQHVIKNTDYNYLRLTNNDFSQILEVMADLKMQLVDHKYKRIVNVNESEPVVNSIGMPLAGNRPNDVYVVHYLKKNVFGGDDTDFAVSDSPKFDNIFYRNEIGNLVKGDHKLLENTKYNIYLVRDARKRFNESIADKIDTFVPYGFLYETIFGKKLYTTDQIKQEPLAEEVADFFDICKCISEMVYRYTKGIPNTFVEDPSYVLTESKEKHYIDLKDGHKYTESGVINSLYIESNIQSQEALMKYIEGRVTVG